MDKQVKVLLAKIVDRCDNTLCNLPSTHPKHRKYFDLFKHLANITSSLAGEEEVLWWKEYTNNRVNYDKVYYNVEIIGEVLTQLPTEIREQIISNLKHHPGADLILGEYTREDLMRKIVKEFSEKEVEEVKEEEIFWEYTVERLGGEFRVKLYPRREWGLKLDFRKLILESDQHKMTIYDSEIKEQLKDTIKSFKEVDIFTDYIVLRFGDNPNIHEDIKNAILKLNGIINEEREKLENIKKALNGIAIPKEER